MPYIPQVQRDKFENAINEIVTQLGSSHLDTEPDNAAKGELNYVIFSIVKRYIQHHGMRYARAQDFIGGTLTCCQHELLRRLVDPYEDEAIKKNGDV